MLLFNPAELESTRFLIEEPLSKEVERRLAAKLGDTRPVCKYFLKGGCNKTDCEFKHARGSREKSVVCKHWLRGLCKKDEQCEFLHEFDMSRMPICHFWTTYGECSNPDCPFLHLKPEDRVKDCLWYYRGFCKHGPKCRNRHVRNEPCVDYMAGFCPKGPDCKFGHPKFELPLDEMRGGSTTPAICTRCNSVGHKPQQCPQFTSRVHTDQSSGYDYGNFSSDRNPAYGNSSAPPVPGFGQQPSFHSAR
ncbi:Cleavage and polyadenylation specificity factor subunit 4 [Plasmodiophora brassicae]|uniref:Cleavage and polyadenylation specificity factor subunit 4 n=1 Tax=Plasmodiophora brassicae TaxID=37360 RepID=A0A3P3YMH3_PLABS|nr:unnamed protein product [Plasmodiophora brassicae]